MTSHQDKVRTDLRAGDRHHLVGTRTTLAHKIKIKPGGDVTVSDKNFVGRAVYAVEVVEVFSYGCIHCFNFDPAMEAWRVVDREGVSFRRLPAVFGSSWEPLARWFYTADVLGVHEQVHEPLFKAIHEHRLDIRDPKLAAQLFENVAGVDPAEFEKVAASFPVGYRIQQDSSSLRKFRISAVPTMVVGGQYRIDGEMAGSNVRMLEVVDFLVQKIRADNETAGE